MSSGIFENKQLVDGGQKSRSLERNSMGVVTQIALMMMLIAYGRIAMECVMRSLSACMF